MEELKENSFSKSAMFYGAIIGISLVLYTFIIYLVGLSTNRYIGFIQYIIIIGGIYISTKKYRDESLKGYISYGRALGFGTLTIFFSSLIIGFFNYILYKFIDPSLIDKILAVSEEAMTKQGLTDEQIDLAIEMTKKFTSPLFLTFSTIFGLSFMGFLFSLLTSAFVKKKDESFGSNFQ